MCNLPYDFGKKTERKIMGGVGSGNWSRFDKKTMTGECHSFDLRYLHREDLLTPGRWFSLRWSRAGRQTGSIRGAVEGNARPERVILLYRHLSGPSGEWQDVREPVPLAWTTCNFGGERPWFICPGAGCGRRVAVLYGHRGATGTATTSHIRASGTTRCTDLCAAHRTSAGASAAART